MLRNLSSLVFFIALAGVAASDESGRIRIVSYNIHHGAGLDERLDLDRISQIIKSEKPDVVCLQEIDRNMERTGRVDMPAYFEEALGMQGRFEPNLRIGAGEYGNLTLARLPIVEHENLKLPGKEGTEPRGCLRVGIKVGEREIDVMNTHFALTPEERLMQARAVIDALGARPAILAGDLNEAVGAGGLKILAERFQGAGLGGAKPELFTAPTKQSRRQIDFILGTDGIEIESTRVLRGEPVETASDHLPIVAEVFLK